MKRFNETRITIRFPSEVAKAIKALASQHDRSINREVVHAVRDYIARQKVEQKA